MMRASKLITAAVFLLTAGAGEARSGLLQETLFSKVSAGHYLLSFADEENPDFTHPVRLLDADDLVSVPYTYEDILRVRENGVPTDVLKQEGREYRYSHPLDLLPGGAVGISYRESGLSGRVPSFSFTSLELEENVYSGALAAALGRCRLGFSARRRESAAAGQLRIEEYPHSDDPAENDYFYDLVEKYFGKDLTLADRGGQTTYVAESRIGLNSGNVFGFRAVRTSSLDEFSLKYFVQDKLKSEYIDAPLNTRTDAYEAYLHLEVKDWWAVKFLAGRETSRLRLDLVPRGPDPATEITDLGNVTLDGKSAGWGISTLFRLGGGARLFGGFYSSRTQERVLSYLSTPVLGKLYFLPIVHRARFSSDFTSPSQQWQLGAAGNVTKKLEVSTVLNCQILDLPLRVAGQTNLAAGLVNSSFVKEFRLRGVKLFYGYAGAGYNFLKNFKLAYRAELSVPVLPKNFKKTLSLPGTAEASAGPAAPVKESVVKSVSGGIGHRLTLQYVF